MSRKSLKKMSEAEANKKLAQYEKIEKKLIPVGICCMLIGVVVFLCATGLDVTWIAVLGFAMIFGGGYLYFYENKCAVQRGITSEQSATGFL